jgi:putative ABC transport system substrate-binding protein
MAGGLMSYGSDITDATVRWAYMLARFSRAIPADMRVMQPTKFQFVINLKTANTLGLEIPPTLLALAAR